MQNSDSVVTTSGMWTGRIGRRQYLLSHLLLSGVTVSSGGFLVLLMLFVGFIFDWSLAAFPLALLLGRCPRQRCAGHPLFAIALLKRAAITRHQRVRLVGTLLPYPAGRSDNVPVAPLHGWRPLRQPLRRGQPRGTAQLHLGAALAPSNSR